MLGVQQGQDTDATMEEEHFKTSSVTKKERKCLGFVGDRQQGFITEGSVGGVWTSVENDFKGSKRLELGYGHLNPGLEHRTDLVSTYWDWPALLMIANQHHSSP